MPITMSIVRDASSAIACACSFAFWKRLMTATRELESVENDIADRIRAKHARGRILEVRAPFPGVRHDDATQHGERLLGPGARDVRKNEKQDAE